MLEKKMTKSESLIYLRNQGFNTIYFNVVKTELELMEFLRSVKLSREGLSIRTEKAGENNRDNFKYPFYLGVKDEKAYIKIARNLLAEGYTLICSKTLDPEDTLCKGTAVFDKPDNLLVEYIPGPGTVRDLDTYVPNQVNIPVFERAPSGPSWLRAIYLFMLDNMENEVIVEWSYYPYPVGILEKKLIIWELRPWQ